MIVNLPSLVNAFKGAFLALSMAATSLSGSPMTPSPDIFPLNPVGSSTGVLIGPATDAGNTISFLQQDIQGGPIGPNSPIPDPINPVQNFIDESAAVQSIKDQALTTAIKDGSLVDPSGSQAAATSVIKGAAEESVTEDVDDDTEDDDTEDDDTEDDDAEDDDADEGADTEDADAS